jgi:hypothetical protein
VPPVPKCCLQRFNSASRSNSLPGRPTTSVPGFPPRAELPRWRRTKPSPGSDGRGVGRGAIPCDSLERANSVQGRDHAWLSLADPVGSVRSRTTRETQGYRPLSSVRFAWPLRQLRAQAYPLFARVAVVCSGRAPLAVHVAINSCPAQAPPDAEPSPPAGGHPTATRETLPDTIPSCGLTGRRGRSPTQRAARRSDEAPRWEIPPHSARRGTVDSLESSWRRQSHAPAKSERCKCC